MKYSVTEINEVIHNQGVLPLFNNPDIEISKTVIQAAFNGGMRIFEYTNRSENALEVFTELVEYASKKLPGFILGIGTIINAQQAEDFHKAGAAFIVQPIITEAVGKYCSENRLYWCPGASTLTEIVHAHNLGAHLVKVFPADTLGGPAYLKAIKAPCPFIHIMASGGVTTDPKNLQDWFVAGADCVGIGSKLFSKEMMQNKDFSLLENNIRSMLASIKQVKAAKNNG